MHDFSNIFELRGLLQTLKDNKTSSTSPFNYYLCYALADAPKYLYYMKNKNKIIGFIAITSTNMSRMYESCIIRHSMVFRNRCLYCPLQEIGHQQSKAVRTALQYPSNSQQASVFCQSPQKTDIFSAQRDVKHFLIFITILFSSRKFLQFLQRTQG